jgi:hypothetical protein
MACWWRKAAWRRRWTSNWPAAADMPTQVLDAIDQRIAGQPLDAKAEQEAVQRKWQR